MTNFSIAEFYGILLGFGCFVYFGLIVLKGIFMIMNRFEDRNIIHHYHHHQATYHYRDKRV